MSAIPPHPATPNPFAAQPNAPQTFVEQLTGHHTPNVTTPLPDDSDVSQWSTARKIATAASMGVDMMPKALGDQIKPLLTGDNLTMLGAGAAAYGVAHYFGAGEVADVALAGAGAYTLGKDTGKFFGETKDFIEGASNAKTPADLQEAAKKFADASSLLMTDAGLGAAGGKGAAAIASGAEKLRDMSNVTKTARALFTGTMATIAGNVHEPAPLPVFGEKPPIEQQMPKIPEPPTLKMNPLFFQENKIRTEGARSMAAEKYNRNNNNVEEPDPQGPRAPQAPTAPTAPTEATKPTRKPEDGN